MVRWRVINFHIGHETEILSALLYIKLRITTSWACQVKRKADWHWPIIWWRILWVTWHAFIGKKKTPGKEINYVLYKPREHIMSCRKKTIRTGCCFRSISFISIYPNLRDQFWDIIKMGRMPQKILNNIESSLTLNIETE